MLPARGLIDSISYAHRLSGQRARRLGSEPGQRTDLSTLTASLPKRNRGSIQREYSGKGGIEKSKYSHESGAISPLNT